MNTAVALVIALLGSPAFVWYLAHKFDARNTEQHNNNMKILNEVKESVVEVGQDVKEVRKDLYAHIAYHAHKETTDGTTGRNELPVPEDEQMLGRETL